jgi:O-antigen/teichoic acid export membrane protein
MHNRKNIISALVNQIVLIAYGLIVPRIIIGTFGSGVNGLVSSITQFLSFISLLEGGLGAVVLAELYKPIEEKNTEKIKGILLSCQRFFDKLSLCFIIYTIVIAITFSFKMKQEYSWIFTSTLVAILSIITLAQYLFSITIKLYLQADQKIYIVNNVISISLIVNIMLAIISVRIYPEIHLLKIASSVSFFIQPIVFRLYIKPELRATRKQTVEVVQLKNRWSGFAQNLAHFVNMNTDVALITVFSSLVNVSIYTVYCLAINALRSIISNICNSYQSALGKYIVQGNKESLRTHFNEFCKGVWSISTIVYCTCLLLINPFVKIYIGANSDANYYQPLFAALITFASYIYCIREPYRLLILSAGKFKETNNGAIIEAVLNLVVSALLISKFGLAGVAIGTVVALLYRMIYFIVYLKNDIISLESKELIAPFFRLGILFLINYIIYWIVELNISGIVGFLIYGIIIVVIESILTGLVFLGPSQSIKLIQEFPFKYLRNR